MGLHPEASGEIRLDDRKLQNETIRERIDLGMMLVPEDRQRLGLIQKLSVGHNITLANLQRFVTSFWLSERREMQEINAMIRNLAIKDAEPSAADYFAERRQPAEGGDGQEPAYSSLKS